MNKTSKNIPQEALRLNIGEFSIPDVNGEGAKSAPLVLKARTGQPIDHWYWGRIVHDLSGMKLSKPRIAVDYNHDADQVIGYLNHFDISSGDLVATGALVPYKGDDRATEVIYKSRQGVPYEASIFFGCDGVVLEEVEEGDECDVNGYKLAGPAVVVREWPLRGVAVCPYGADMNTETRLAVGGDQAVVTIKHKGEKMVTKFVEGEKPVEATKAEIKAKEEADAKAKAEAEAEEKAKTEQAAVVEAEKKKAAELAAKPGLRFLEAFGREKGGAWFAESKSFEEAEKAFNAEIRSERDALLKENAELKTKLASVAKSGTDPVKPSEAGAETSAPVSFMEIAKKLAETKKLSMKAAIGQAANENPELFAKYRVGKK